MKVLNKPIIEPFLKWAGGKRWFIHNRIIGFPNEFSRYFEPFVGSGAVFFHLLPGKAFLSDSNRELINAYRAIKMKPELIELGLRHFQEKHNNEFYYRVRSAVPTDPIERAIRFIYLNRTCFNGLYRENRKGAFNVPVGTKRIVKFPAGYLAQVSRVLKNVTIKCCDFEEVIDVSEEGDFVYVDPPYTVMHNSNNFIKYNANLFSWQDQLRLHKAIQRASLRGVKILMTNANHEAIKKLYSDFENQLLVSRSSVLSASAIFRKQTSELIIGNFNFENNSFSAQKLTMSKTR